MSERAAKPFEHRRPVALILETLAQPHHQIHAFMEDGEDQHGLFVSRKIEDKVTSYPRAAKLGIKRAQVAVMASAFGQLSNAKLKLRDIMPDLRITSFLSRVADD